MLVLYQIRHPPGSQAQVGGDDGGGRRGEDLHVVSVLSVQLPGDGVHHVRNADVRARFVPVSPSGTGNTLIRLSSALCCCA